MSASKESAKNPSLEDLFRKHSIQSQTENDENNQEAVKIDDLAMECILLIIENLNFRNLVNVSGTNRLFQSAARRIFSNKFNQKMTRIKIRMPKVYNRQLLHSFGDLISNLWYDIYHETVVIEYGEQRIKESQIPFPNVKILNFNQHQLPEQITRFNDWFPNLEKLRMISTKAINTECIEVHMPALREFTISNQCRSQFDSVYRRFTTENVKIAIKLNPQLRYLSLHEDDLIRLDADMIRLVHQTLPQLEEFNFHFEDVEQMEEIQFDNVKVATFCVPDAIELEKLPIVINGLDNLTIISRNRLTTNSLEFAARYPNLKKLKIRTDYDGPVDIRPAQFAKFASRLPLLEDFYIDMRINSRHHSPLGHFIADFLYSSTALSKLHIRFLPNQMDHRHNMDLWDKILRDIDISGIKREWLWSAKRSEYDFPVLSIDIVFERKP